jgi:hypothetical protein
MQYGGRSTSSWRSSEGRCCAAAKSEIAARLHQRGGCLLGTSKKASENHGKTATERALLRLTGFRPAVAG